MITNISIKNIKGYGDPATSIDLELKANRVNLLYAPNGSGKSSLVTAFASLRSRSLAVEKENKYHMDEALDAELKITLDDEVLTANKQKNEISPKLTSYVINSGVIPGTTQHNMGKGFTSVSSYLDVEDIELVATVPENVLPSYKITEIRKQFGVNGKILPNMPVFLDKIFLLDCELIGKELYTFKQAQYRMNYVSHIQNHLNGMRGTAENIVALVDDDLFADLEANENYSRIMSVMGKYVGSDDLFARYAFFYELFYFWENNKEIIRKANRRTEYENYKRTIDENLLLLDRTWKEVQTVETEGKLVLQLPRADEISNGQRDNLTLITELLKFGSLLKEGKQYLLLIDEVFDYLDDANTIAAQCFLTNILKKWKGSVYLCILTHLNPYSFKNYIFSEDKINHVYLFNTKPTATPEMKAFISFRESLDKENDAAQADLYNKLSHDLFHYNPIRVDYSTEIARYKTNHHLNQTFGCTEVLHAVLMDEVNKYLSGAEEYDPYAVAMAIRLRVEKLMYDHLPTQPLKDEMVDQKMTKYKMKYCAEKGYEMPEVFNIVNAIHNDADHLKFDVEQDRYIEKPMVYKLQNLAIKTIIANLFKWKEMPLTTVVID